MLDRIEVTHGSLAQRAHVVRPVMDVETAVRELEELGAQDDTVNRRHEQLELELDGFELPQRNGNPAEYQARELSPEEEEVRRFEEGDEEDEDEDVQVIVASDLTKEHVEKLSEGTITIVEAREDIKQVRTRALDRKDVKRLITRVQGSIERWKAQTQ